MCARIQGCHLHLTIYSILYIADFLSRSNKVTEEEPNSLVSKNHFHFFCLACFLSLILMHHDFLAFLFLDDRLSNGLELLNLVVSFGVMYHSWAVVWDMYSEINQNEQPSLSVRYKVS